MEDINIINSIEINDIQDFTISIGYNGLFLKLSQQGYIFRGHSSSIYKLIPTSLRQENKEKLWNLIGSEMPIDNQSEWDTWQIHAEYLLLQQFYRECDVHGLYVPEIDRLRNHTVTKHSFDISFILDEDKWLPKDLYEIAGLAQHYGLPTRLLDWTNDFLTSIYFAVAGVSDIVNKESFHSDDYMVIWALNASFVDFLSISKDKLPLKIIRPRYHGNTNLSAQKGLFTFWEIDKPHIDKNNPMKYLSTINLVDRSPLEELLLNACPKQKDYNNLLYKIRISYGLAKEIYHYLETIGYGASRHFPGYYGMAKKIVEDSCWNKS